MFQDGQDKSKYYIQIHTFIFKKYFTFTIKKTTTNAVVFLVHDNHNKYFI